MVFSNTLIKPSPLTNPLESLHLWVQVWKEKRYALKESCQLLREYMALRADHPQLSKRHLYELLVAESRALEIGAARELVERAEESFAMWPEERDVRLRDVIRYIVVSEFMSSASDVNGIGPHFGEIVERIVSPAL